MEKYNKDLEKNGLRYGTGTYYSVRIDDEFLPLTDDILTAIRTQAILNTINPDQRRYIVCHLNINPDVIIQMDFLLFDQCTFCNL
jgi:hypothetical protein